MHIAWIIQLLILDSLQSIQYTLLTRRPFLLPKPKQSICIDAHATLNRGLECINTTSYTAC